jgi:hypothetical protein
MELFMYRIVGFSLVILFVLFFLLKDRIFRLWKNYKFSKLISEIHSIPIFDNVEDSLNDQHVIIKFCWLHRSIIYKMEESKFPLLNDKEFSNFSSSALKLRLIKNKLDSIISKLSFFRQPYFWIKINFLNFFMNHLMFTYYLFPKRVSSFMENLLGEK